MLPKLPFKTERGFVNTGTGLAVILLVGVALGTEVRAQDRASDEATVRSLDDRARIAAPKRDVPALERLWSDQLVVNAPNNKVIVGKRAVLDDFVRTCIINFSKFERQVEFIRIDGDLATIMGLETVVPITDSPANGLKAGQPIHRRVTNIWQRVSSAPARHRYFTGADTGTASTADSNAMNSTHGALPRQEAVWGSFAGP
jgi:Domain of unknown function (DUF4440)